MYTYRCTMSVKNVVLKQYQRIVNRAGETAQGLSIPKEGWIRTVRKSLGMSGAQLGRKLGLTRSYISNTEKAELSNNVTLKTMKQMAEAMNCRLVYAIVPESNVHDILEARAKEKSKAIVERTSIHMALEAQTLSQDHLNFEVQRLAEEMVRDGLTDLWNDK